MSVKQQWLTGIKEGQKEQHIKDINNFVNGPYCQQLLEILKKYEESIDRMEMNPESYDNPNWAYRQAHNNGARQALKIIKDLLTANDR